MSTILGKLTFFGESIWYMIIFIITGVLFYYGVKKIIISLQSVEYFSLNIKDDQSEQMQNAVIKSLKFVEETKHELPIQDALLQALRSIEETKEPKPLILFDEKPPIILKLNTEGKINFQVDLKEPGNIEARNVDVWFLLSPEIEILASPNSSSPFKQGQNFCIPNANTVRFKFNLVKKHTKSSGVLKLKAKATGEFKLRYKADCDNHAESVSADKEIGIIVLN